MVSKFTSCLFTLLCILLFNSCVGEGPLKLKYNVIPAELDDDWQISPPELEGIDSEAIKSVYQAFFSNTHFLNGISLLVIRNGHLVAEGYARNKRDQNHYEAIQSTTKSVTSLLTGIAKDEGFVGSLEKTLYEIYLEKFDNYPAKKIITLSHLLTMTSGIAFDNDNFAVELEGRPPNDSIKYILNKEMYNTPGAEFYYRDSDPHLLSYALQVLSDETLASFASTRFFKPLNITNYQWIDDDNKVSDQART